MHLPDSRIGFLCDTRGWWRIRARPRAGEIQLVICGWGAVVTHAVRLSVVGSAHSDLSRFQRALNNAGVITVNESEPHGSCPTLIYFTDTSPELPIRTRVVSAG